MARLGRERRPNPFVPRFEALTYVSRVPERTVFAYRGLTVEVERTSQKIDGTWWWSWTVYEDPPPKRGGIFAHGEGALDHDAAAILARYQGDLLLESRRLGEGKTHGESEDGFHLRNMFELLTNQAYDQARSRMPTAAFPRPGDPSDSVLRHQDPPRSVVARELRTIAGPGGTNLPYDWQRESYDWYENQPLEYRIKLIDRAMEYRELMRHGLGRGKPKGTWRRPNPQTLKRRCLR